MRMDPKVLGQLVELSRERGELTPRYVASAGLMVSLFLAAYGLMRGFQTLDRVVTPGFRREPVEAPTFIVGNPRSGTTFLHRLMSQDDQFSSLALYETLMPSSFVIRSLHRLSRLDAAVGHPVQRFLGSAEGWLFRGWKGIHHVSFSAPEEDEMLFMYALRSPALMLVHPGLADLPDVRQPSALPDEERARLARDLREAWQRHTWAVGHGKRLLVKNALAAGRLGVYRDAFPDLRVVHLVRHPYQSIPSMVSMFSKPWHWLNPQWTRDPEALRVIARLGVDYYRQLDEFVASLDPSRRVEIDYRDLVADPEREVRRVYAELDLPLSAAYEATLRHNAEQARGYRSEHTYDLEKLGLSREWIHASLADVFERRGFDPGLV